MVTMKLMMFLLVMAILECLIYTVMYATPENQHMSVDMAHVFPVFEGENADLKTFAVIMTFLIFLLGLIRLLVNGRKS